MPRKKPPNVVVKIDFGIKKVVPSYDFSYTVSDRDWLLVKNYGVSLGQKIYFEYTAYRSVRKFILNMRMTFLTAILLRSY